jgi:hypothetical protein
VSLRTCPVISSRANCSRTAGVTAPLSRFYTIDLDLIENLYAWRKSVQSDSDPTLSFTVNLAVILEQRSNIWRYDRDDDRMLAA